MKHEIVGIGACVLDTLITLPVYPQEDTKLGALSTRLSGGGPTATGLVAAARLGADTCFLGNLSTDSAGDFLLRDFERHAVSTEFITRYGGYRSFTSNIWLSQKDATRTCVFDKGSLPPLCLSEQQLDGVAQAQLLMVDGNELSAACRAAAHARDCGVRVVYDCGGLYDGVEQLLALTDIMIPSEEFALAHTGAPDAMTAAQALLRRYQPEMVVVTCGGRGGVYLDKSIAGEYPVFKVSAVDTNGAGDVFHGAFAAGLLRGLGLRECCVFASAVSALKCTGFGARESIPDMETTLRFLKENGYEL